MFKVGDRVLVAMKSRGIGPGGWQTDWVPGVINRLGRVNVRVELDRYYYGFFHWMKPERVKSAQQSRAANCGGATSAEENIYHVEWIDTDTIRLTPRH